MILLWGWDLENGSMSLYWRQQEEKKTAEGDELVPGLLPSHILVDILSRLPVKTVIICKSVCKEWRNAISDPCFPQMHLEKSPVNLMLYGYPSSIFWLFQLKQDLGKKEISQFNCSCPTPSQQLVGSCNGLLCFLSTCFVRFDELGYFVLNPVRNEGVIIPMPTMVAGAGQFSRSGFGFCARTNLYKVIRMVYARNQVMSKCEVFTLGTKVWRTVEDVPIPDLICKMPLNGAVHWICCSSKSTNVDNFSIFVCAFKIEDEKWDPILLPLPLRKQPLHLWLELGVLDNCLVLCDKSRISSLDIWMMKDYGVQESWTKCWSIGRQMPSEIRVSSLGPLKLTKDGDLFLFDVSHKALVCFNQQKRMLCKQKLYGFCNNGIGIAYVASFISPIQVMKEC